MEGDGEKETKGLRQEDEVLVIYSLTFSLHLPVSILCIFKHFPFVNTCLSHFVFPHVSNCHSHVPSFFSQIIEIPDEGEKSSSPAKKEEKKEREREATSPSAEKDVENEKDGEKEEKSIESKKNSSSDVKAESSDATSSVDTSKTKGEELSTT